MLSESLASSLDGEIFVAGCGRELLSSVEVDSSELEYCAQTCNGKYARAAKMNALMVIFRSLFFL
jgi:hypothetical protein